MQTKAQRRRSEEKRARKRNRAPLLSTTAPLYNLDGLHVGRDEARCVDCGWFAISDRLTGGWDRLHYKAEGHALLNKHAVGMFRSWQEVGSSPVEVVTEETP